MAIVLHVDNHNRMPLDAFIARVGESIDLHNADSLIGLAADFRALANDPALVARHLNALIQRTFEEQFSLRLSGESLQLGNGEGFAVLANIWTPPRLDHQVRPQLGGIAPKLQAHNHNYNVMSVAHFGAAQTTDIYEFNPVGVHGHVGEFVELRFVERVVLTDSKVVIYREDVDAHARLVPDGLSVSLSLIMSGTKEERTDQFLFDPQSQTISGHGPHAWLHKRAAIIELSAAVGNDDTLGLLDRVIRRDAFPRLRENAVTAASRLHRVERARRRSVVEHALGDPDPAVRTRAEESLALLVEERPKSRSRARIKNGGPEY